MNSILNINIRVAANQARAAFKDVEADVNRLQASTARANAAMAGSAAAAGGAGRGAGAGAAAGANAAAAGAAAATTRLGAMRGALATAGGELSKFGKNAQWTGRQLEMNFTLPIALVTGAAVKWRLENEKAMTSVNKVYGDGTRDVSADLKFLGSAFQNMSSMMGVNQAQVINVGAAWAQAGQEGVNLANATQLTLNAMIVGGQSAEKATESLIALQAIYKLNTAVLNEQTAATMTASERATNLTQVMADLNAIENATQVSTQDLVDVITRAGPAAKEAGMSVQELAQSFSRFGQGNGFGGYHW